MIFWVLRAVSAILTRIFLFVVDTGRYLMSEPEEVPQKAEISQEGKEGKKRKEPAWKKYCDMPVEERRKHYRCGRNYSAVNDIPTWAQYWRDNAYHFSKVFAGRKQTQPLYSVNESFNNKISLWRGDITVLEIDAIVNAANRSLLGGGGVDGCIHRAAGDTLRRECATLNGCDTGDAKITSGHKLPAKYVIHTVGPVGEKEEKLRSCYATCLKLVKEHQIGTVAFCCISTGIYGYPNYSAAMVALDTVRRWLETGDNADQVQRIIFCTFLPMDVDIYENLLPGYFPVDDKIHRKDEREKAPPDELEEKTTNDEENISAGIPEPPTREELLSGELAAGGQDSGKVTVESETPAGQGNGEVAMESETLAGQGSGEVTMESETSTGQGSGEVAMESETSAGQDSGEVAMKSETSAGQVSGEVTMESETSAGQVSGKATAESETSAGQVSGKATAESEKDQEKAATAQPSL